MSASSELLNVIAREHLLPGFIDNFFYDHPTLEFLWKNRDVLDGGVTIDWSFYMDDDDQVISYLPFQDFLVSPDMVARRASLEWADLVLTLPISQIVMLKTKGKQNLINYVMEVKEKKHRSFLASMSRQVFGDGRPYASASFPNRMVQPIVGLDAIVAQDRSYGGFDSTTYPALDSYLVNANDTTFSHLYDPSQTAFLPDMMATAMNETYYGHGKIDYWTMPIVFHEALEKAAARGDVHLTTAGTVRGLGTPISDAGEARLGITSIFYRGVEVVADRDCPAGKAFGLNSKAIQLKTLQGADLTFEDFSDNGSGDAIVANWKLSCQLVSREPRALAKIYGGPTARS